MSEKKLCVGIDFHVVDGIFQGSRSHVLEFFSRVIKYSPEINFVIFLEKIEFLLEFSEIFASKNVRLIRMRHSNPILRLCWQLPMMQLKYKIDLLHTQYILPFPNFSAGVVTIHDILFETHPLFFPYFFRLRSKILIRLSAYYAFHIFTVSNYSKNKIVEIYGIKHNKISVIHNGVDLNKFYPGSIGEDVIIKKGLVSKGYLLTVGRLEPRKNYINLLRAYANLKDKTLPLVIIGQPHFSVNEIYQEIENLKLEDRVIHLKDVADKDLPAFYRHAKIFIYPTWAEGFGMPTLESMASGTPVITSKSTSIPEVVGSAAILVEPSDKFGFVNAIEKLQTNKTNYENLVSLGFVQVRNFNWDIQAQKIKNVYVSYLNKL